MKWNHSRRNTTNTLILLHRFASRSICAAPSANDIPVLDNTLAMCENNPKWQTPTRGHATLTSLVVFRHDLVLPLKHADPALQVSDVRREAVGLVLHARFTLPFDIDLRKICLRILGEIVLYLGYINSCSMYIYILHIGIPMRVFDCDTMDDDA